MSRSGQRSTASASGKNYTPNSTCPRSEAALNMERRRSRPLGRDGPLCLFLALVLSIITLLSRFSVSVGLDFFSDIMRYYPACGRHHSSRHTTRYVGGTASEGLGRVERLSSPLTKARWSLDSSNPLFIVSNRSIARRRPGMTTSSEGWDSRSSVHSMYYTMSNMATLQSEYPSTSKEHQSNTPRCHRKDGYRNHDPT